MDAQFWHDRWEKHEIGFHQPEVHLGLQDFWRELQLPKKQRILVPLCGKTNDMLWLLECGYLVLGVELSPIAVAAFFQENKLSPQVTPQGAFTCWSQDEIQILCGDYFSLTAADLNGVTAVYDRAALIALPPDLRYRYVQHLTRLLLPGTKVLLITLVYPPNDMTGPPFSVTEEEVYRLYQEFFSIKRLAMKEILADNSRLAERGLTRLQEGIYLLERLPR